MDSGKAKGLALAIGGLPMEMMEEWRGRTAVIISGGGIVVGALVGVDGDSGVVRREAR